MEDWPAVAKAIKDRMDESGTSQKQLAERSGLSTATLREIARGDSDRRRSAGTLAKISEALGWPSGYLLSVARHTELTEVKPTESEGGADDRLIEEVRAIRELLERIDARLSK